MNNHEFAIQTEDDHVIIVSKTGGMADPDWLTAEVRTGEVYVSFDAAKMVHFITQMLVDERDFAFDRAHEAVAAHDAIMQEHGTSM